MPSVEQASVSSGSPAVSYQDVINVVCDVGYVVTGTDSRVTSITCGSDQTFGALPTCEGELVRCEI